MTNRLDQQSTITLVPSDPIGNRGAPLELTALILDPESDYDHDGMLTAAEELAGTDADNGLSLFVIKLFNPGSSGIFNLGWTSVVGKLYTVEFALELNSAVWTPVDDFRNIPGTGSVISVELQDNEHCGFYRVRVSE